MLWAQRQTFVLTVAMVLGDIPAMSLAMMIMSCVISGNFVGKGMLSNLQKKIITCLQVLNFLLI